MYVCMCAYIERHIYIYIYAYGTPLSPGTPPAHHGQRFVSELSAAIWTPRRCRGWTERTLLSIQRIFGNNGTKAALSESKHGNNGATNSGRQAGGCRRGAPNFFNLRSSKGFRV